MGDEPSIVPTKFITDDEGGRWSSLPRWEPSLNDKIWHWSMAFIPLFLADFFSILCETVFCKQWMYKKITIMIIINAKLFLERHFCGMSIQFLEIILLLWKKAVLHKTTDALQYETSFTRLIKSDQGNEWLRNDICGRSY